MNNKNNYVSKVQNEVKLPSSNFRSTDEKVNIFADEIKDTNSELDSLLSIMTQFITKKEKEE